MSSCPQPVGGSTRVAGRFRGRSVAAMTSITRNTNQPAREVASGMGLLLGLGIPTFTVTFLIIGFAMTADWWLLPLLMITLIGTAGAVVWGLLRVLE